MSPEGKDKIAPIEETLAKEKLFLHKFLNKSS